MTLGGLFKEMANRIREGETDHAGMARECTSRILNDDGLTREAIRQLVHKRISDMLSAHLKPSGVTARVPAGQMSWLTMEPVAALDRMRRYIRAAAVMKARADNAAAIVGYVDASGIDPATFPTLRDLCVAANVPAEYVDSLAA